ncbi:MAG: hypothetical protein IT324_12815, partial [Anaerolineae bacterium]|nr:hypothetical protein [Anaerolineae bacterium]
MANVDEMVQQAIVAFKAGRKAEARQLLMTVTELDEGNEQAWLWLSGCVDSPQEQQICLENVLAINPGNTKAQKGLEAILRQNKQPPIAPPSRPAAPPPPSPPAPSYSSYDDDLFAGTGFGSTPAAPPPSTPDPTFDTGWDMFAAPASDAPASSVDWNRSSGPAAYGSGRDVKLPSDQEYDNWIEGMGIGSAASSTPETDFDLSGGPFAGSPTLDSQPDMFDSSFGSDLFSAGSASADPYGSMPASGTTDDFGDFGNGPFQASSSFSDDLPFSSPGPSSQRGSGEADNIFGNVPSSAKNNPLSNLKNRGTPAFSSPMDDGLGDLRSDFMDSSGVDDLFHETQAAPSRHTSVFTDEPFAPPSAPA